jgi:hypothetical protein
LLLVVESEMKDAVGGKGRRGQGVEVVEIAAPDLGPRERTTSAERSDRARPVTA